jgi:AMMECR1 domain-containing protein
MFSIGATIMKAGLLEDFKDVYDSKLLKFNSEVFNSKKDKWSYHPKYS